MLLNAIKELTFDKLFVTSSEAVNAMYTEKISRAINECLLQISNALEPVTKEFIYNTAEPKLFTGSEYIAFPPDFVQIIDNDNIRIQDKHGIYQYADDIEYVSRTGIYVHKPGKYKIQYDANYPVIVKIPLTGEIWRDFDNTIEYNKTTPYRFKIFASNKDQLKLAGADALGDVYELSDALGPIAATYAASVILSIDDPIRSATLRNEYEMMLARLNTAEIDNLRDYHSSRGWY